MSNLTKETIVAVESLLAMLDFDVQNAGKFHGQTIRQRAEAWVSHALEMLESEFPANDMLTQHDRNASG